MDDYSNEVRLNRSRLIRWLLIAAGIIFVALGTIGVFLPVLPTTPFLLLAAACFARGSKRFYNWLMNNRYFGEYIRNWRVEKRIPLNIKIYAIAMIWITIGFSIVYVIPLLPIKILMAVIALSVSIYISRFPS